MSRLRIYSVIPLKSYNASMYYRGVLPLTFMGRMDLPTLIDIDDFQADCSPEERYLRGLQCDIQAGYQIIHPAFAKVVDNTRQMAYQFAPDGTKLGPPSFVMDTDDDLFNVSPTNHAFRNLGFKDFNGNVVEDGATIWGRDAEGNAHPIWKDGDNVDLAANRKTIESFRNNLAISELLTTSGENTKQYLLREFGPEVESKIHIFPNCIDFREYPKIELAEHPDEVRILWQGSPTHWEDMMLIKRPLTRLMEKHPNVTFVMWGADYPWFLKGMDKERVTLMPWMDYRIYKLRLNTIGHDIALAPLRETVFNSCRSGIKWYESSACWKPAATIASKAGAFKLEMEDGKTGMLFETEEEFETKLEALIVDAKLRKELASNAKDWIRTNRDPVVHVPRLYEKYVEIRKARLEWPEPENPINVLSETDKPDVRGSKNKGRRVNRKRSANKPTGKGRKKRASRVPVLEQRGELEVAPSQQDGLHDGSGDFRVRSTATLEECPLSLNDGGRTASIGLHKSAHT